MEKLSRNHFRTVETTRVLNIVRAQRTHLKTCPYCGFQTEYMPEMEFHLDDTKRSWLWTYRCPFTPTNTQRVFLTNLPPEILIRIMSLAGEASRRSLRRTSKLMVEIYRIVVRRKVRDLIKGHPLSSLAVETGWPGLFSPTSSDWYPAISWCMGGQGTVKDSYGVTSVYATNRHNGTQWISQSTPATSTSQEDIFSPIK